MTDEAKNWEEIACYLADCHAATASHVLTRKSSSSGEKRRQLSIARMCLDALRTGELSVPTKSPKDRVIARLRNIINQMEEPDPIA